MRGSPGGATVWLVSPFLSPRCGFAWFLGQFSVGLCLADVCDLLVIGRFLDRLPLGPGFFFG